MIFKKNNRQFFVSFENDIFVAMSQVQLPDSISRLFDISWIPDHTFMRYRASLRSMWKSSNRHHHLNLHHLYHECHQISITIFSFVSFQLTLVSNLRLWWTHCTFHVQHTKETILFLKVLGSRRSGVKFLAEKIALVIHLLILSPFLEVAMASVCHCQTVQLMRKKHRFYH